MALRAKGEYEMSLEERLSKVEGRLQEQSDRFSEIAGTLRHIDQKIDVKIDSLRDSVDAKFDALRSETTTHFRWIVGLLLTFGFGILTAILGVLTVVLKH